MTPFLLCFCSVSNSKAVSDPKGLLRPSVWLQSTNKTRWYSRYISVPSVAPVMLNFNGFIAITFCELLLSLFYKWETRTEGLCIRFDTLVTLKLRGEGH